MTPIDHEGRRMSDHDVPMDVAQQAVRIGQLASQQAALAERVATDGQATRDALSSIQSDIKQVVARFGEILSLQHHQDNNSESLKLVRKEVSELSLRFEGWIDQFERNHEQKWSDALKDRDQWRKDHERENAKDRETIIRWGGIALGLSLLGGTVVGMFQWNLALRFGYIEDRQARQETIGLQNRQLIENLQDGQSEIKLKLVRMERNNGNDTNPAP